MTRLVALMMAAVALCGCRTPPPSMDPFLRTTVPPPGTTTGDQYYQGGSQPAATTPAATPAPVVPPPSKYAPPGGSFNYQQSSIDRPKAVTPGSAGLRMGSNWLTGGQPVKVPAPATSPTIRGAELATAALPPEATALPQATPLNVAQPKFGAAPTVAATVQQAAGATVQLASGTTLRAEPTLATAASPISAAAPVKSDIQLTSATAAQSRGSESTATFRETAGSDSAAGSAAAGDGGTVIRILETRESSDKSVATTTSVAESSGSTAEPARMSFNEITNLPLASPAHRAAVRSTWTRSNPSASSAEAVAAASSTPAKSAEPKPTVAVATAGNTEKYGYTPDYSSLRGKLEYSQSARQWKLRYIPIDGQTDRFGGSVVLPNSPLLEACKPGEFVAVTGNLTSSATTRGFSPLFDLRQVEPAR